MRRSGTGCPEPQQVNPSVSGRKVTGAFVLGAPREIKTQCTETLERSARYAVRCAQASRARSQAASQLGARAFTALARLVKLDPSPRLVCARAQARKRVLTLAPLFSCGAPSRLNCQQVVGPWCFQAALRLHRSAPLHACAFAADAQHLCNKPKASSENTMLTQSYHVQTVHVKGLLLPA